MFKSFRKKIANLNVKQKKKKNLPKSRFTCIITKFSIPSTFHSRIFRNIINLDIRWLLKRKIILEQLCSKAFKRKPSWNVILKTRNLKKKGNLLEANLDSTYHSSRITTKLSSSPFKEKYRLLHRELEAN